MSSTTFQAKRQCAELTCRVFAIEQRGQFEPHACVTASDDVHFPCLIAEVVLSQRGWRQPEYLAQIMAQQRDLVTHVLTRSAKNRRLEDTLATWYDPCKNNF